MTGNAMAQPIGKSRRRKQSAAEKKGKLQQYASVVRCHLFLTLASTN